jgi:hypothetical protein
MKHFLRQALLVGVGSAITLLALRGLPTLGLTFYGTAFRAAYVDCRLAKAHSAELSSLQLDTELSQRLRKTAVIEELSCLDYQELRYRLRQFKASSEELDLIETGIVKATDSLQQ